MGEQLPIWFVKNLNSMSELQSSHSYEQDTAESSYQIVKMALLLIAIYLAAVILLLMLMILKLRISTV